MSAKFSETFSASEIFSAAVRDEAVAPSVVRTCARMSRSNSKRQYSARKPRFQFAITPLAKIATATAPRPAKHPCLAGLAEDAARFATSKASSAWRELARHARVQAV